MRYRLPTPLRPIPALLLALCLVAPGTASERARRLTILYFNDIHGHLEPWKPDPASAATVGGIARIAALVERIRRENRATGGATLVLEAGDILQGTPMSSVFQGEPDVEAFNAMRLDAMAIGNHEFDFGQANLKRLVGLARFPVLSANVYAADGHPLARPSAVLEPLPGFRVGVLGLTTADTPTMTFPANVTGLTFDDPVAAARHAVPVLEGQCDLVVALTHIGEPEDRRLAREVPGVDVVIGGHTHLKIAEPERVGGAVICQAQDNGRYLGRLDLIVAGGKATVASGELIPVVDGLPEDHAVAGLVASFSARLRDRMSAVVGRSRVLLDGERANVRSRETTLGNFVADLMREAAHAEVAVVNGGALRASIGAGTVTYGDVLTALPFDTTVVTVTLPGSALRAALDRSAAQDPAALPGGFLQVSGVTYEIENGRATVVRVGGAALDDARRYTVAMPDFLLLGGDGYTMISAAAADRVDTGLVLSGLVVDFLRKGAQADARVEGRIVRR